LPFSPLASAATWPSLCVPLSVLRLFLLESGFLPSDPKKHFQMTQSAHARLSGSFCKHLDPGCMCCCGGLLPQMLAAGSPGKAWLLAIPECHIRPQEAVLLCPTEQKCALHSTAGSRGHLLNHFTHSVLLSGNLDSCF
jgi:hypothetical protein